MLRDWRLSSVAAFPAPEHYIGRIRKGAPVGEASLPRLEPGDAATVDIDVTAPGTRR